MKPSESRVRVFFSADLVGSTAYQNNLLDAEKYVRESCPAWAKQLEDFYEAFHERFSRNRYLVVVLDNDGSGAPPTRTLEPTLVKAIGDELLFECLIETHTEALSAVQAFCETLVYYNERLKLEPLAVKGAAWLAGFPINNHEVTLGSNRDYVGPSIDAGFRVAKNAATDRLAVSVDLALLLCHLGQRLYFDGVESLKGVLGGKPYPRLFVTLEDKDLMEFKLKGHSRADAEQLENYCCEYIQALPAGSWLSVPYFESPRENKFREMPEAHQRVRELMIKANEQDDEAAAYGADVEVMMFSDIHRADLSAIEQEISKFAALRKL